MLLELAASLPALPPLALPEPHRGHFARHEFTESTHRLARDPLGVHKLFFSLDPRAGTLRSSNYLAALCVGGAPARQIWSVPLGHGLVLDPAARRLELRREVELSFNEDEGEGVETITEHARRIRARLDSLFAALADALAGRRVYLTLSGGLDSTVIAALAREHLSVEAALTFAIERPGAAVDEREDLAYARLAARELGLPLHEVFVAETRVLESVDEVLVFGQDWRSFNVHCGLVNAALGRALAEHESERPVLLSGDGMNELVADYTPVKQDEKEHYALPALPPARLRRFLVGGLDAGDREVGIFWRHGIETVQPFLLAAEAYAALPPALIERDEAKQQLVRAVMGARVPEPIYRRPKTRAQVGHDEQTGGTLALLERHGLDQDWLTRRFEALFGLTTKERAALIRAGFYRFPTRFPEEA